MRRRSVVQQAGLAGILASLSAPAVHAQAVVKWRLVTTCNPLLDAVTGGVELFVRQIGLLSGGRFQVSLHQADESATPASLLEALQQGEMDALHVCLPTSAQSTRCSRSTARFLSGSTVGR